MAWKHTAYHLNDYDLGRTRLKQQLEKNMKIDFVSPPTNSSRNEKKKTKSRWQLSCLHMNLLPEVSNLPNLVAINLVKVEILFFKIVM